MSINVKLLKKQLLELDCIDKDCKIYEKSINSLDSGYILLIGTGSGKKIVLLDNPDSFNLFEGEICSGNKSEIKICPLSHENAAKLRAALPFTAPKSLIGVDTTIGLGDRLGIATPGHCRILEKYDAMPVLAQQSIRELNLTGRDYQGVMDDATFGVFQEGYKDGFGADGDHLKKSEEIDMAIDAGFNMITLDCSEHIDNSIAALSSEELDSLYNNLSKEVRDAFEAKYIGEQGIEGAELDITSDELKKVVLTYQKMLAFIEEIYNNYFKENRDLLFEISIDETDTATSPEAHYIIADYLISKDIEFHHMAPRFIGEFQKGIDYIGDEKQFRIDFSKHAMIAANFGYKISVHSGSDKFMVFPAIGEYTNQRLHLKTAGTNWLEALRVVAHENPKLFREILIYALRNVETAKQYYHIKGIEENIPPLEDVSDKKLGTYLDIDDSRQILHITYGLLLNEKDSNGNYVFRNDFFDTLNTYEEEYYKNLIKHIGKHLKLLKV